jgi:chromosomal replication initiation ATPase DnaA
MCFLSDFPRVKRGADLHSILYEGSSVPSIYSRHICRLTEECAQSIYRLVLAKLRAGDKGFSVALPRQTAMYLAHVAFSLSFSEIGALFRRDRTTVAHACRVVEDLRDDPSLDRALTIVEAALLERHAERC